MGEPVATETERALDRLEAWLEGENFQGWDPHDALNSPVLRRLAGHNRICGIVALQILRRSPINLRGPLRVVKSPNPKGMGLFLSSYLCRFRASGSAGHYDRAIYFSEWLQRHALTGHAGACWGYNFEWPNRGFSAAQGTPTIVSTSFV